MPDRSRHHSLTLVEAAISAAEAAVRVGSRGARTDAQQALRQVVALYAHLDASAIEAHVAAAARLLDSRGGRLHAAARTWAAGHLSSALEAARKARRG